MSTIQEEITRIANATNDIKDFLYADGKAGGGVHIIWDTLTAPKNINDCRNKLLALNNTDNLGILKIISTTNKVLIYESLRPIKFILKDDLRINTIYDVFLYDKNVLDFEVSIYSYNNKKTVSLYSEGVLCNTFTINSNAWHNILISQNNIDKIIISKV